MNGSFNLSLRQVRFFRDEKQITVTFKQAKLIVHIFGRQNSRAGEMHARLEDTQHAGNTVI